MQERKEDTIYNDKVNYTNMIMSKINEVLWSLRNGSDATRELQNLLFLLTNEIKLPINSNMENVRKKYAHEVEEVKRLKIYPETNFNWSGKHKLRWKSNLIREIQSDAIYEMLNIVINRLDELGLLFNRDERIKL